MTKDKLPACITLRYDIKPGDLGFIVYLHAVHFAREYGFDYTFEARLAESLAKFYSSSNPHKERLFILERDGQIVGSVGVLAYPESLARIRWFFVESSNRGIGLGKALLNEAIGFCKQCGYKSIFLETFSELAVASHLYKAKGFEIKDEKKENHFGKSVTKQHYILNL